jgi:hypothetical protein
MKRLALLPLLLSPLSAKEAYNVLPDAASDWKMAGPGSFEQKNGISTAKGGMGLWWYGKKEFTNACFTVEFLAPENTDNSGIFVRFQTRVMILGSPSNRVMKSRSVAMSPTKIKLVRFMTFNPRLIRA